MFIYRWQWRKENKTNWNVQSRKWHYSLTKQGHSLKLEVVLMLMANVVTSYNISWIHITTSTTHFNPHTAVFKQLEPFKVWTAKTEKNQSNLRKMHLKISNRFALKSTLKSCPIYPVHTCLRVDNNQLTVKELLHITVEPKVLLAANIIIMLFSNHNSIHD